ncbi:hypothetical protein QAD02_020036 [Eretmocerus hayati]|uniref:Uncharacterized protein n=1 Tax=Eretmocerus hayati TaxID=131215 RepID=A0ACC2PNS6_9HYME|nr:hypothetical protein QAD02_020036 [Eretmocerus hayati]
MQDEAFVVKVISVNNCFVYLPESWLKKLSSRPNVLRLEHDGITHYLSWNTRPSPDSSRLCISATFARNLSIKEGDEVLVSCAGEPPPVTSAVVAPVSSHDREILELQIENIQTNVLNQVSIVAKDQTIVSWITKSLCIALKIKSLSPLLKYGRLVENTEIHVEDVHQKSAIPNRTPAESESIISHIFGSLPNPLGITPSSIYRVHPMPDVDESISSLFTCYIWSSQMPPDFEGVTRLWRIRKIREDKQHAKSTSTRFLDTKEMAKEFVVLVRPLECHLKMAKSENDSHFRDFKRHPCIYMNQSLMKNLRTGVGGKVILELINENGPLSKCSSIEVSPCETIESVELFRNQISEYIGSDKLLLNSLCRVNLENGGHCFIKLLPESCSYAFFDKTDFRSIDISMNDRVNDEWTQPTSEEHDDLSLLIQSTVQNVFSSAVNDCERVLSLSLGFYDLPNLDYDRENILIRGASGSGKTTLCKLLLRIFRNAPRFTHTCFVDCRSLKGKKVEVIQKLFLTELSHAVYYQPSILFLDDIESITCANSNNDEVTADSTNAARISDVIFNLIREYQCQHYISVVATCTDFCKVGKKLREARGSHFFRTILTIPSLGKEERVKILQSSFQDKLILSKEIDLNHYGDKTEGWVAQDLIDFANKAAFATWKRHVKGRCLGSPMLHDSELAESLEHFSPSALRGLELHRGENGPGWSDVGGLASVKLALIEMLRWPLNYPRIFARAPIKIQSGVLLYGMPGTGKTMLAGAIARECGLNLISVKGPELLSKYIGASEEAVRNIFEKAHRAKPCVLFFDEFDSLAPRRGHDSTGVTDRVVNQLLTHLDGIESREGVAVVAASSRPDLLDPALLRPGRLDKSLLCPLPDQDDREEILAAICRAHQMDGRDLDLRAIAALTHGFTGADLNAVVMQARLDAIEKSSTSLSIENNVNVDYSCITQQELIESVASTKPSLSTSEKDRYNKIYARFTQRGKNTLEEFKQQKATLA